MKTSGFVHYMLNVPTFFCKCPFSSIDALIRNSFYSLIFIVVLCHIDVYVEIQGVFCINYSEAWKIFVDMVDYSRPAHLWQVLLLIELSSCHF